MFHARLRVYTKYTFTIIGTNSLNEDSFIMQHSSKIFILRRNCIHMSNLIRIIHNVEVIKYGNNEKYITLIPRDKTDVIGEF
jgi:hypothetical protein